VLLSVSVLRFRRVALLGATVLLAACGGDPPATPERPTSGRSTSVDLTGAGATFPYPLYSRWFSEYAVKTGVKINYQSIGSGGGIRQLREGVVDFGASEAPLTDAELAQIPRGRVLQVPAVVGGVVLVYNVPGLAAELKLTADVVADIFLGRITKWNDPRLAELNAGVALPNADIVVVYRADGSGTTYVFTDWLTRVSAAWSAGPGHGKDVRWPVGLGAKGNEGVAGQVKTTPNTIGFVELAYATQNRLPSAALRNRAGFFVAPTVNALAAAAAGVENRLPGPNDFRVSLVDTPVGDAYPLASFSWLLLYQAQSDDAKGRKLVDFIRWAVRTGQGSARSLDYAPLPPALVTRILATLDGVSIGQ
jgi:phosphate transport system substrate-binding protein